MAKQLTKQQSSQIKQDIMTHLDGFSDDLITDLCQVVVAHTQETTKTYFVQIDFDFQAKTEPYWNILVKTKNKDEAEEIANELGKENSPRPNYYEVRKIREIKTLKDLDLITYN